MSRNLLSHDARPGQDDLTLGDAFTQPRPAQESTQDVANMLGVTHGLALLRKPQRHNETEEILVCVFLGGFEDPSGN